MYILTQPLSNFQWKILLLYRCSQKYHQKEIKCNHLVNKSLLLVIQYFTHKKDSSLRLEMLAKGTNMWLFSNKCSYSHNFCHASRTKVVQFCLLKKTYFHKNCLDRSKRVRKYHQKYIIFSYSMKNLHFIFIFLIIYSFLWLPYILKITNTDYTVNKIRADKKLPNLRLMMGNLKKYTKYAQP